MGVVDRTGCPYSASHCDSLSNNEFLITNELSGLGWTEYFHYHLRQFLKKSIRSGKGIYFNGKSIIGNNAVHQ